MRKFQDTVVLFLFLIFLVIINSGKVNSQKYLLVRIQSQDDSGVEGSGENKSSGRVLERTRNSLLSLNFAYRSSWSF